VCLDGIELKRLQVAGVIPAEAEILSVRAPEMPLGSGGSALSGLLSIMEQLSGECLCAPLPSFCH